jgi:hypothetical protein
MARIPEFGSSLRYKTQKENLKVACANLRIGRQPTWVSFSDTTVSVT